MKLWQPSLDWSWLADKSSHIVLAGVKLCLCWVNKSYIPCHLPPLLYSVLRKPLFSYQYCPLCTLHPYKVELIFVKGEARKEAMYLTPLSHSPLLHQLDHLTTLWIKENVALLLPHHYTIKLSIHTATIQHCLSHLSIYNVPQQINFQDGEKICHEKVG